MLYMRVQVYLCTYVACIHVRFHKNHCHPGSVWRGLYMRVQVYLCTYVACIHVACIHVACIHVACKPCPQG